MAKQTAKAAAQARKTINTLTGQLDVARSVVRTTTDPRQLKQARASARSLAARIQKLARTAYPWIDYTR